MKLSKPEESALKDAYTLIADPNDDKQWIIELKKAPWSGIKYKYLYFKPIEDKANDRLIVKMHYDIIDVPSDIKERTFPDDMDAEFNKLVGDIVIELLEEQIRVEKIEKQLDKVRSIDITDLQDDSE